MAAGVGSRYVYVENRLNLAKSTRPEWRTLEPTEANPTPSEPGPLVIPTRTSSLHLDAPPIKRISPGLELRLKRLRLEVQRSKQEEARRRNSIGRIPEDQLAELEESHRPQVIEVRRRGRTWTGPPVRVMSSAGGVRLDGGPVMSEGEASMLESDVSSIISISDQMVPSDTEEEDGLQDTQKYRLPDIGKTRLHLRTKEPLSPTPRQAPRSPRRQGHHVSPPSTPRTRQSAANGHSPLQPGFPDANGSSEGVNDSDFVSTGLSRSGSIYTLGRASLAGQLSHLTSLRLPDANSLAKKISSIPTSTEAAKALSDASEQIRIWISKASDVLSGLNAEDDVEWAAAGGRDGVEDIDKAINRFQRLVDVYLVAIEELQTRDDVSSLSSDELKASVKQMEGIIASWQKVKENLKDVKEQVEIAMEWEELWNSVLGEIGQEMEGLNRLVFEMEEKRHQGVDGLLSSKDSIDINELETIVEERPGKGAPLTSNRFSLPPFSPTSAIQAPPANETKDDSSLLALFARMQPLRASLDFLPMRLSVFHSRGNPTFPSACLDLEQRQDQLESQWKKLEADAESLRRELGEDRWVLVFRNAGRQALKMEESITRSYNKLKEAVDWSEHQSNTPSYAKKVESYDAKKIHYGPAIDRVLAIIDRGVLDRLTVNGEILRLQSDMKRRWMTLQTEMRDMDLVLEDINTESRDKQLRDSVSTVMSSERSIASSLVDTPGSSPASSVIGTSRKSSFQGSRTPTPLVNGKTRKNSGPRSRIPSSIPRRIPLTESGEFTSSPSTSPLAMRTYSGAPSLLLRDEPLPWNRPRWVALKTVENRDFLPLSALEPSPYAKAPVVKQTNFLRSTSTPTQTPSYRPAGRTPLGRNVSTPNEQPPSLRTPSTVPKISMVPHPTRKSSLPVPATAPARAISVLASKRPPSTFTTPTQTTNGHRGSVLAPPKFTDGNDADTESPSHHKSRPTSALAVGRRSSMLRASGKSNDLGAVTAAQERPRWR